MTDLTQKRLNAINEIRKNPKLKKILGTILENMIAEIGEIPQAIYDNGQWQFNFPYSFERMHGYMYEYAEAMLKKRGLELHKFDVLPEANTLFYMTEDEVDNYITLNKLTMEV